MDVSAAQEGYPVESFPALPDTGLSDTNLIEDAYQAAVEAHAAGLLAAPFGVDDVALNRARRRARRSDTTRLLRGIPDSTADSQVGGAA